MLSDRKIVVYKYFKIKFRLRFNQIVCFLLYLNIYTLYIQTVFLVRGYNIKKKIYKKTLAFFNPTMSKLVTKQEKKI